MAREKLLTEMGGKCSHCNGTKELEFGHTKKRTWIPNKLNRLQRLKRYREDWMKGECQVECKTCNRSKRTEAGWLSMPGILL